MCCEGINAAGLQRDCAFTRTVLRDMLPDCDRGDNTIYSYRKSIHGFLLRFIELVVMSKPVIRGRCR